MSGRLKHLLKLLSNLPFGLQASLDLDFGTGGQRALRMHVVWPHNPFRQSTLPAVVYLFGGGWESGDRDQGLRAVTILALCGYVAASIDYRLSNEAVFPAQLEDCKCAIRYLRAHAAEYHLNPERIAAVGPSAGGHLAALLGTSGGIQELEGRGGWASQRSDVQAVVDWFGPTDLVQLAAVAANPWSLESAMARLLGAAPLQSPSLAARANPITYVSRTSPPFLIMHGTEDSLVPLSQSELLHNALISAGSQSELTQMPGKGHEFLGWRALGDSLTFLNKTLKSPPTV